MNGCWDSFDDEQKLGCEELKWALARDLLPSGLAFGNSSAGLVAEPVACPLASSTSPAASEHQQPAPLPGRPVRRPCALSLSLAARACPSRVKGKNKDWGRGWGVGFFEMSLVFFAIF